MELPGDPECTKILHFHVCASTSIRESFALCACQSLTY